MTYEKYLAFFQPPTNITEEEGAKYHSFIKGISTFLKGRSMNPLLVLNSITNDNADYIILYQYRNDPFIKRILENPGKYNPEEVILLGYLPIFMTAISDVSIRTNLYSYFYSDIFSDYIRDLLARLNGRNQSIDEGPKITNWTALKKSLWTFLTATATQMLSNQEQDRDYQDHRNNEIKRIFSILSRAILLIKLRLLICIEGFIPESLELSEDIFRTFLSPNASSLSQNTIIEGPSEIRHAILTIIVTLNQTLFCKRDLNKNKDELAKRIYEDNKTLTALPISETFAFIPENLHVGIIMDGNRRWGNQRNLPGHFFGTQKTEELLRWVLRIKNIDELTLYCLSIDNLEKRDRIEIQNLDKLLQIYLSHLIDAKNTLNQSLEIAVIGELTKLSMESQDLIHQLHNTYNNDETIKNKRLNLAIAYDPIRDSERTIARLTQTDNGDYKYMRTPIDYVIRTGNVMRTSGFFPMQTLYAEWLFLPMLWPDMTYEILVKSLKELGDRSRRYGL